MNGMDGFIAEVAEVGVGNACRYIRGGDAVYQWINDNGPVDLMRSGVKIQQKFVAAGGRFGLGAITEHLHRYPDFVASGGKYQIPRDRFEVIQKLHAMPREGAGTLLTRGGDGPSLTDWERVQVFFGEGSVGIGSLEPSHLRYSEVQKGAYQLTLDTEEDSLRSTDQSLRDDAYHRGRPTLREGAKATLAAAAIEGGPLWCWPRFGESRLRNRLSRNCGRSTPSPCPKGTIFPGQGWVQEDPARRRV